MPRGLFHVLGCSLHAPSRPQDGPAAARGAAQGGEPPHRPVADASGPASGGADDGGGGGAAGHLRRRRRRRRGGRGCGSTSS
eukprot:12676023-Prorocentrum_lima.AAC.1